MLKRTKIRAIESWWFSMIYILAHSQTNSTWMAAVSHFRLQDASSFTDIQANGLMAVGGNCNQIRPLDIGI